MLPKLKKNSVNYSITTVRNIWQWKPKTSPNARDLIVNKPIVNTDTYMYIRKAKGKATVCVICYWD